MMNRWFIDAHDARAGFAIAVQRSADLESDDIGSSGPVAFIAPPSFVPEFLDGRSIGFGLSRGYASTGLFVGKDEVEFDSLRAVVEFVRRSYLRGAGGDGPDESGGGPPPAPEGSPGELGRLPEGGEGELRWGEMFSDPIEALIHYSLLANSIVQRLSLGHSGPPSPPKTNYAGAHADMAVSSGHLARGALWVAEELMRRRYSLPASEHLDWITSLQRFVAVVVRMGLWPRGAGAAHAESELENAITMLLSDEYWDYPRLGRAVPSTDGFDDLALLPAPASMATFARADSRSLQALLSGFVALPTDLLRMLGNPMQSKYAETVLFAAACLCLEQDSYPLRGYNGANVSREFARRLVTRAMGWLDDNLPKRYFSTPVEGLIDKAASIRA
jgi:hypothetical protein